MERSLAVTTESPSSSSSSDIRLMVYDLSDYNSVLGCVGLGIFHTGVCVHGVEFSYGGHDKAASGCFITRPYSAPPPARFREAIVIGRTDRSAREVMEIVALMGGDKFMGNRYHLLEQNCNHFSEALLAVLLNNSGERMPRYINRAASAALCCACLLPADALVGPVTPETMPETLEAGKGRGSGDENEAKQEQQQQQLQQQEEHVGSGDDEILLSPGKTKAKRSPLVVPRLTPRRYQLESDS